MNSDRVYTEVGVRRGSWTRHPQTAALSPAAATASSRARSLLWFFCDANTERIVSAIALRVCGVQRFRSPAIPRFLASTRNYTLYNRIVLGKIWQRSFKNLGTQSVEHIDRYTKQEHRAVAEKPRDAAVIYPRWRPAAILGGSLCIKILWCSRDAKACRERTTRLTNREIIFEDCVITIPQRHGRTDDLP